MLKALTGALAGLLAAALPAGALEGGRPGEIFTYGAGARPLGMGSAFTAVARDATAVYYNPAGLGMLPRSNVQFMHNTLFEGAYYDYLGFSRNFNGLPGGWGLQFLMLGSGDADGRDENNLPTDSFGYTETAFSAAAGAKGLYFSKLALGGTFKYLNRSLADSSDTHLAFDLGLQYGPLMRGRMELGLLMSNVVNFKTGDTSDKLPFFLRAGAAYRVAGGLVLAADADSDGVFRIGTEYAMELGSLRLGFDGDSPSMGLGTSFFRAYTLDLAVSRHPDLGISNKISLGYQFGRSAVPAKEKEDKPKLFARDYLLLAQKALDDRDYASWLDNVDKAMALDHSLAEGSWGEKHRRLSVVAEKMNLRFNREKQKLFAAPTEQAMLAKTALLAQMDAQGLKAMLYAHAAAGTDIKESVFEEFLNVMAGINSIPVRKDEILPKMTLIKEKLRKSELYFQMTKFDLAAKECEEVLLLDERSALAWTRLGSAYYAIGDFKRSRESFLKALELDPNSQSVRNFIQLQGWQKGAQ